MLQNFQQLKSCHSTCLRQSLYQPYKILWSELHPEQYKNRFLPRTISEWNASPPDLVYFESVDEFSSRLQTYTT